MLTGDLHEFNVVEVLGLLGRCRRPGALLVEGEGTGVIYCGGGDVTFATTQAQATVGDVLVAQGYLDADDWSTALASTDPRHAVADTLAMRGTDPVRLSRLLRTHTEEAVFELGLWRSGTFRFEAGVDHSLADTFRFPVEPLLRSVGARVGQWDLWLERLQSPSHLVAAAPGDDDGEDVVLSRTQFRILTTVARPRSLTALAEELGRSLYDTAGQVIELLDRGLVAIEQPVPDEKAAPRFETSWTAELDRLAAFDAPLEPEPALVSVGVSNGHDELNGHAHFEGEPVLERRHVDHRVDQPAPAAPNGAAFVSPGDAPARDLILRLLTAVKDL